MEAISILVLGAITLVALIFVILAKGEVGKLAADNASLKAALMQAQKQAQSATDKVDGLNKQVQRTVTKNAALREKLKSQTKSLSDATTRISTLETKAEESKKVIESLTTENAKIKDSVDAFIEAHKNKVWKFVEQVKEHLGELDPTTTNSHNWDRVHKLVEQLEKSIVKLNSITPEPPKSWTLRIENLIASFLGSGIIEVLRFLSPIGTFLLFGVPLGV